MPYTLVKGLAWILLALALGVVIGWLLRSVTARRQVARARNHHVDTVEMERLRGRVAELEAVVGDRERLRAELDAHAAAHAPPEPTIAAPPPRYNTAADAPPTDPVAAPEGPSDGPDVAGATAVLGRAIALDDLTVVEGIGPKIEALCHGIGIRTWRDLAETEVSLLRTMLHDAGPRMRTHDPSTWPAQAQLLAAGRWAEFEALVAELHGGRASTATPGE
jgi:predicted flap endonuclease-1-like 5' DNA nuclease